MAGAVALDRWEAFKVAWKASRSDWGYEDVEATAQDGQLPGRAPEGPAVALLHSDAERREFISAGAAAGLAASPPLCSILLHLVSQPSESESFSLESAFTVLSKV